MICQESCRACPGQAIREASGEPLWSRFIRAWSRWNFCLILMRIKRLWMMKSIWRGCRMRWKTIRKVSSCSRTRFHRKIEGVISVQSRLNRDVRIWQWKNGAIYSINVSVCGIIFNMVPDFPEYKYGALCLFSVPYSIDSLSFSQ